MPPRRHCRRRSLLHSLAVLAVVAVQVSCQADGQQRNSFLPQLTAIAGVISSGNVSVDSALQLAVSHHLQGWFSSSTLRYADAARILPTNTDCYIGAALSYHFQLSGCGEATRSLRTFLRLHREQGVVQRRAARCRRAPTYEVAYSEPPGKMRVFIDNGVFVDASTFRGMAHHVIDEYFCHFDPADVRDGEIVFVNTFLLCAFARLFHPLIRARYVLITHNSDYPAPALAPGYNFTSILSSRKLIAWFAQNLNVRHQKLFPVPQGFSVNTKTLATDWNAGLAFGALKEMNPEARPLPLNKRLRWVYVNFAVRNETLRHAILQWARRPEVAHFVTVRTAKITQEQYRQEIAGHCFVWCPPGNGLDTHRKYEALQQGTIPLVMFDHGLDDLHRQLPVVTVGKPQDVTLELLQGLLPRYQKRIEELWTDRDGSVLTAAYWRDYVLRRIAGVENKSG